MQKIRISVKSLRETLRQFEKDHIEMAELQFIPGQIDDGNYNPSFLHIDGISKGGDYMDYEDIEEASLLAYLLPRISA